MTIIEQPQARVKRFCGLFIIEKLWEYPSESLNDKNNNNEQTRESYLSMDQMKAM